MTQDDFELAFYGVEGTPEPDGVIAVTIKSSRGDILGRFYPCEGEVGAALFVGGAGGEWAGPGDDVYGRLGHGLVADGVSSLHVRFRQPGTFSESVLDVMAGLSLLQGLGASRVALVGISFGAAVVIHAAVLSPHLVRGVAALSCQLTGTERVAEVSPRPLLLVHGTADQIIDKASAELIYGNAVEPKELVLYEGAGHGLGQCQDELYELLRARLVEWVGPRTEGRPQ